ADEFPGSEIGARTQITSSSSPEGTAPLAHLTGHALRRAHRHLCAKALSEFSHERLLAPTPATDAGPGAYDVRVGDERWTFRARVLPLEHWAIDVATLRREVDGAPAEPDAQE